ncbi:MAG: helicase-related protein [Candidatus Onthovivens sp.]|nr:helicase-related protein [Candidatus Onthovivens sp.]
MSRFFICPICKNEDPRFIGYLNGKPYCRKCISFKGEVATNTYQMTDKIEISTAYELTNIQKEISNVILDNFKNKFNQLVYAVCGAGKTELVFAVIEYALNKHMRVGFAIPRKDVVYELSIRFKNTFKKAKIVSLYGGNTETLEGDIICLTTHQLYRFNNYFDLLILDELDAFPYKDNDVLYNIFLRSIKGNYILMSATISEEFIKKITLDKNNKLIKLFVRFHLKKIPVPVIKIVPFEIFKIIFLVIKIKKYLEENKQVLIFVPTINLSKKVYIFIKNFVKPGYFVNSKSNNREEIINKFRNKQYMYLVTTAVLERGVTLENLQVIIYQADHEIFNQYSLTQISGRVGRKASYPDGEVIFLCDKKTKEMEKSIFSIDEANKVLQKMLS